MIVELVVVIESNLILLESKLKNLWGYLVKKMVSKHREIGKESGMSGGVCLSGGSDILFHWIKSNTIHIIRQRNPDGSGCGVVYTGVN